MTLYQSQMKTKHPVLILARQVLRALRDVDESLKIVNGRLLCLRHIRSVVRSCESKAVYFRYTLLPALLRDF